MQAISAGPAVREFAPPPAAVHAGDDRPALPALPEPVDGVPTLAASLAGFAPAPIAALETASNHSDEGDGFLSGAFKKTGAVASASIVKTGDVLVKSGAVAGASIVDVFRGLAGAMKKVSPFVP